jgi:TolB-like protein/Tfp pilus assembly protein PilF
VAAALAAAYVALQRPRPGAAPRTLAVLPLANLTGDPAQEYFSDGMTDAVITRLASVPGLHVISRQSVMGYKSSPRPMREIARELGVEVVVEGSVIRSVDRVRVTAQLIHAPTDRHLWAQSYDRPLADVLALQEEIAAAIAGQVERRLAPAAAPVRKARPVDPRAYELFLRGRFHLHELNPASLRQAADYFDRSRAVDPAFAPAVAGLATSMLLQEFWGEGSRSPERIEEVRRTVARALELDPNLADAHDTLGRVLLHYDFDWPGAAAAFRRAVELEPSSMSAHNGKSLLHQTLLQWDEAAAEAARAVALDPLSPMALAEEGRVFYRMRRYAEAEQRFKRALDLNPGFGSALDRLIQLLLAQGRLREAREALGRLEELPSHRRHRSLNLRARLEALSGNLPAARALLAEVPEASLSRASAFVALGEHDHAFRELEGLVATKTMTPYGWSNPPLDPLRGDPRFAVLVGRMGLPVDLLVAHGRPPGP